MKTNRCMLRALALTLCLLSALAAGACGETAAPPLPEYPADAFVTTAWWAPYEISEESFALYKEAGLNTVTFVNHSRASTAATLSQTRYYLGSDLTMETLEMCRKTGLKAAIAEGGWYSPYETDTPFSEYDLYGDYEDLIIGVHITDEPSAEQMRESCSPERIADFKSVYSVPYMINLHPVTAAGGATGTLSYAEYLQTYEECVLQNFPDAPYVSVDFYPYHTEQYAEMDRQWVSCYEQVSALIAEYDAEANFYIQTAEGNEFTTGLTEDDIRWQVYMALCFGGTQLSYYCYAVPGSDYNAGEDCVTDPMYSACLLDQNNQPTHLYGFVREINAEIQAFAPAFKAYSFTRCMPVCVQTYGDENFKPELYAMNTLPDFSDRRYVSDVATEGNCLVGCFDREEDEAYMLVNYGYPDETDPIEVTVTLKGGATHLAVYGGEDFTGTPEILAGRGGRVTLTVDPGEGKFIVPLS